VATEKEDWERQAWKLARGEYLWDDNTDYVWLNNFNKTEAFKRTDPVIYKARFKSQSPNSK